MRPRALLLFVLAAGLACALWLLADGVDERSTPDDPDAGARSETGTGLEGFATEAPTAEAHDLVPPTGAPDGENTVALPDIGGPILRGRVVDEAGAGVPGVTLHVALHATAMRDGSPSGKSAGRTPLTEETLVTDADGGFRLVGTHASGCIVQISFSGVPRRFTWPAPRRFAFRDEPVALTLTAGASIAGRVLPHPEWGQARALLLTAYWRQGGVRCSRQVQGGDSDATFFAEVPPGGCARGASHAQVERDGSFEFFGLPPGALVSLEALPAFELQPATMTVGEQVIETAAQFPSFRPDALGVAYAVEVGRQDVEIVLGGGGAGALDLTVLDEQGRPLAEHTLLIEAAASSLLPARRVFTSAEGQVLVPGLRTGTYELRVQGQPGMPPRQVQRVHVPSGPLRLTFAPAGKRRVHGEIVGAGALGGFRVLATGASLKKPLVALADGAGRFSFETYAQRVDLRVERFGDARCAHLQGVVPGGEALTLELQPGASIEGRVLDVDGQPLRHEGWARAFNDEVSVRTAFPGGGRFRLDGLPPGRYTVQAGGGLLVPAEVSEVEAGRADLELRIPEQR